MHKRILSKIISTGLNLFISILIGIVVPRVIGPSAYGDFSYIIATYGFLFQLFMLSSNTAYIYFLSHKKYKVEDVNTFYFIYLLIISLLVAIIGVVTINTDFALKYFWNGLDKSYLLYLGLLFALFLNLQDILVGYSDSTKQTIKSEKIKLFSRFVLLFTILLLIYQSSLDIYSYFILLILTFILFFILFFKYISFKFSSIGKVNFLLIFHDIYSYVRPLIIFTLIASSYAYLGKYVLQATSGSIEQGYYNLAYQLSFIPVTFISSLMVIYMSEMTQKFQENNLEGVKEIFLTNIFKIYAIHAFISFFMIINAKEIILLSVGVEYIGALNALQWLTLFSLLHTFGTLSRNVFLSSARTKLYSIINSTVMVLGLIYLLAVLNVGTLTAHHLAIVITIVYFIRVFIQLIINIKYLNIDAMRFFKELFIITMSIYIPLKSIYMLDLTILYSSILSIVVIVIVNFLYKDYINLKILMEMKK